MKNTYILLRYCVLILLCAITGCQPNESKIIPVSNHETPLFKKLNADSTNIRFINTLEEGLNTNVLVYEYLYNGGGVATADFNSDGLIDIYFTSNLGENKLYINKGNLQFRESTKISNVFGREGPWKTGVTAVDINGDHKMDIYVSYSGALPAHKRTNELYVNIGNDENGTPIFNEKAGEYGLNSTAYSNQAYFFDYDKDGDLDAILLNHNPKSLPVLNEVNTAKLLAHDDALKGIRVLNQDKGYFNDVTTKVGVNGSALTYGLGVGISDVNNDGWVDFYVSNDYTVPDYLYLNNGDGTFSNTINSSMGHISHFSMGNDIADIDNDGLQDIFTLDMLPEDNARQKLLLAPDNYEKFDLNIRTGFHYQYMRNMMQLNNGNGTFSEIGQQFGVSNTDWSWASLLTDLDNDGWKDLMITNGYFRDYTNLDFINYMEDFVKSKGRLVRTDVLEIIKNMPSSNVTNYGFKNNNGIGFQNKSKEWGFNEASNSNGASYADLDNDGDLDLIVNNINKPAFIFQNQSNVHNNNYLQVKLEGEKLNTQGIGAKVTLYQEGKLQKLEQVLTKGYLSSVSPILNFGLGDNQSIDSLVINWSSGKGQILYDIKANQRLTLVEKEGAILPKTTNAVEAMVFNEIESPIAYANAKNVTNDFKRQPLLINQLSHEGPCMIKGDVNNDGLQDIFIGGDKNLPARVYIQQANKNFIRKISNDFNIDQASVDSDAVFVDVNLDGFLDVYVVSGGYHDFIDQDGLLRDRLYLGDGSGHFEKSENALPEVKGSGSCVRVNDINKDGYPDLFVGGRVVPGRYPEKPESFILINNGAGKFTNKIKNLAPELQNLGMVTDALWLDLNADEIEELVVVGEWLPITVFSLKNGMFQDQTLTYFDKKYSGWWNTITASDVNNDGKEDLIIGNIGTNTQFKVSDKEPAELYFADFDKNGAIDPIFCFYIQGETYPYLTRDELLKQLAGLQSKFNSYKSYANATMSDIFDAETLDKTQKLEANYMKTSLFLSTKEGGYKLGSLPLQAQYAPVYEIKVADFNSDNIQDLLLLGNNHSSKLRLGKQDANYGTLMLGNDSGNFTLVQQIFTGLNIQGAVKSSVIIDDIILIGLNQQPIRAYKY